MGDPSSRTLGERFRAQLLSGPPARSAVEVVDRLLAVQAQDLRGARLAIRARSRGVVSSDIDLALSEERTLVVTWLNRGTLHLVRSQDYPTLHLLTAPFQFAGNERRLRQEGVSAGQAEEGLEVIGRALAGEGPLNRDALRERLDTAGIPTARQALVHLLVYASLRGLIVRGPIDGKDQRFVLTEDWLGPQPTPDRNEALATLARRYLAGHGPATERDLAKWSGLPMRDARAGLASIRDELVQRPDGTLAMAGGTPRRAAVPPPRLLGAFEPLLLGWESRDAITGNLAPGLITDNGVFRAFALVDGSAVATWRLQRERVVIDPLAPIRRDARAALDEDAGDVSRFLKG